MKIRANFRVDSANRELLSKTISNEEKKINFKKIFRWVPNYGYALMTPGGGKSDYLVGDPHFMFRVLGALSQTDHGLTFLEKIELINP